MYRLVLVAAAASAACSQSENDRPATLVYITEAILQPSCSQYDCHSAFANAKGYTFDTVEAARRSLSRPGVVIPGDVGASLLSSVLIRNIKRMPYDSPLPAKDIELIQEWIVDPKGALIELTGAQ